MAHPSFRTDMMLLVGEHYERLYRYAYRLTGRAAEAEDLVQQCYLTAQEKLDQLRRPEEAGGWLCAILRSWFLREARRKRPVPAASLDLDVNLIAAACPATFDEAALQQALDELPLEFRVVVLMFYFEHQSYRQIAEQLALPVGTVMSRLSRGKAHLRKRLGGDEAAPLEQVVAVDRLKSIPAPAGTWRPGSERSAAAR